MMITYDTDFALAMSHRRGAELRAEAEGHRLARDAAATRHAGGRHRASAWRRFLPARYGGAGSRAPALP
jgi:hypothetical protein